MKTNFKEYLEKKEAQRIIDKIAGLYENKKIVLYGAGLFAGDLLRNYDFSKLNIIGVADKQFQNNYENDYYGYKKLGPYDLLEMDFDLLLITTYDDSEIRNYLKNELFQGEDPKFKIRPLIRLSLFKYIQGLFKGEF